LIEITKVLTGFQSFVVLLIAFTVIYILLAET